MFTLEQIRLAHSKVKSGADFPSYAREIKELGVYSYVSFVTDGHTDYFGKKGYQTSSQARYEQLAIADRSNIEEFIKELKDHQQGGTDYITFCRLSAKMGVEKWVVDITKMTCTYYDKSGGSMLIEDIP